MTGRATPATVVASATVLGDSWYRGAVGIKSYDAHGSFRNGFRIRIDPFHGRLGKPSSNSLQRLPLWGSHPLRGMAACFLVSTKTAQGMQKIVSRSSSRYRFSDRLFGSD